MVVARGLYLARHLFTLLKWKDKYRKTEFEKMMMMSVECSGGGDDEDQE